MAKRWSNRAAMARLGLALIPCDFWNFLIFYSNIYMGIYTQQVIETSTNQETNSYIKRKLTIKLKLLTNLIKISYTIIFYS